MVASPSSNLSLGAMAGFLAGLGPSFLSVLVGDLASLLRFLDSVGVTVASFSVDLGLISVFFCSSELAATCSARLDSSVVPLSDLGSGGSEDGRPFSGVGLELETELETGSSPLRCSCLGGDGGAGSEAEAGSSRLASTLLWVGGASSGPGWKGSGGGVGATGSC